MEALEIRRGGRRRTRGRYPELQGTWKLGPHRGPEKTRGSTQARATLGSRRAGEKEREAPEGAPLSRERECPLACGSDYVLRATAQGVDSLSAVRSGTR